MKIEVFGKKRQTKEGKSFMSYFATIKKGEQPLTVNVKFREECGNPKKCPCVVEFDKKNANLSTKERSYKNDADEDVTVIENTLWISSYTESEYIDTSLDDVE